MKKRIFALLLALLLLVPIACISIFADGAESQYRFVAYKSDGSTLKSGNAWSTFTGAALSNSATYRFFDDFGADEATTTKSFASTYGGMGDKYFYVDLNGHSLTLKDGVSLFDIYRDNPITVNYSDGTSKVVNGEGGDIYIGDSGATITNPEQKPSPNHYHGNDVNVYVYSSKEGGSISVSSPDGIAKIRTANTFAIYTGTSKDNPGTCLYTTKSNGANLYIGNQFAISKGVSIGDYAITVNGTDDGALFKTTGSESEVYLSNVCVNTDSTVFELDGGACSVYSSLVVAGGEYIFDAGADVRKVSCVYTDFVGDGTSTALFKDALSEDEQTPSFSNCNFAGVDVKASSGKAIIGAGCAFDESPLLTGGIVLADNTSIASCNKEIKTVNGKKYVMCYEVKPGSTAVVGVTTEPSSVFANGMVFQREEPINVYGIGSDGDTVKVTFKNSKGETEVGQTQVSGGRWSVSFAKRAAERGCEITVEITDKDGVRTLNFTNIDIGEVWVMGGQSNSTYELYKMEGSDAYLDNADNFDNIRIYTQSPKTAVYADYKGTGTWHEASSQFLKKGNISAVAYVMATRLATEMPDVTIALVNVNWSGSSIQAWIEESAYAEYVGVADAGYQRFSDFRDFYNKNGRLPKDATELSNYIKSTHLAIGSYNGLIAHLEGYAVRGAIWYQGCSNLADGPNGMYDRYFDAMRACWGKAFGNEELPFFVIQLAPYINNGAAAKFRASQYEMAEERDGVYLVTAHIDGNVFNASDLVYSSATKTSSSPMIHPSRKAPVGLRLADSVPKNIYGFYQNSVVEAAKVQKVEFTGGKVVVTFDTDLQIFRGSAVEGFEVAGADGNFVTAKAEISGNKVILTSTVANPVTVRYGYGTDVVVELEDGTIIECSSNNALCSSDKDTGVVILVDKDGTTYTFNSSDEVVVRSFLPGNLTNDSGYPTPTFSLAVGYGE